MLYIRPNYFKKFKCVSKRCEATCCAGWQIVIDEESLLRYKSEVGEYGELLHKRIDWGEGVLQDCRKRCAFLTENHLCELYQKLGKESLCITCANYPRHIEEFENQREITLTISCPEVARIILEQREPVDFEEEEIEEEAEEFDDFDPFFFSYLEDARKILIAILQNRRLPMVMRGALVIQIAEELQTILEEGDLFDFVDVFEKYEEEANLAKAIRETEQEIKLFYESKDRVFLSLKAVFERLYELEYLADDWEENLKTCQRTLYGDGEEAYWDLRKTFQEYCMKESFAEVNMEIILEQLLVYFVFTYFCGAVYDDNVIGKIRMSVDSVTVLYEMFMAKWKEQGGCLSVKDMQRILYRYSRELEHSDVNLEIMQSEM